ncbi:hypothetical protein GW915_03205 [bacterium]|nr:hypothetical protein [bacterium]
MNLQKPLLRGHIHQASFFVALGACGFLISTCNSRLEYIATTIYTLGLLLMLGVSTLYHRIHWEPKPRKIMKKLDHCMIYLLIAATSTPVSIFALSESSNTKLLLSVWGVALVGILQSLFFVNLPKIVSALIYLFAGYMVLPYVSELHTSLGTAKLALLAGGGLAYSIGAVCYGLKRPKLIPQFFGYHEVFHALVSLGAFLHFWAIKSILEMARS